MSNLIFKDGFVVSNNYFTKQPPVEYENGFLISEFYTPMTETLLFEDGNSILDVSPTEEPLLFFKDGFTIDKDPTYVPDESKILSNVFIIIN